MVSGLRSFVTIEVEEVDEAKEVEEKIGLQSCQSMETEAGLPINRPLRVSKPVLPAPLRHFDSTADNLLAMQLQANATSDPDRFNWMLPSCAAALVVLAYVSMAFWAEDAEFFLSVLLIAPALILASISLSIYAVVRKGRKTRLTFLSTVGVLWLTAIAMFLLAPRYDYSLRTAARWLIWSRDYKAEVLAEPPSKHGNFKHTEWDSWGFVPAGGTTAYLVFDPSDSLSGAAKSHGAGRFDGIPCAVYDVNRLEKNWYTVVFYTDEDWSHCNQTF